MKKGWKIASVSLLGTLTVLLNVATGLMFGNRVLSGGADSYTSRWGWNDLEMARSGTVDYYPKHTSSKEEAFEKSRELALDIEEQGAALLKNENGTLPLLPSERKISVFGSASVNMVYGGTGSGQGNREWNVDLYAALEQEGFEINPSLHLFYLQKYKEGYKRGEGTDMNGSYCGHKGKQDYGYSVNEVEKDAYKDVEDSFREYKDAAIVVFSRSGGEGQDLPTSMEEFYENDARHYLELTKEEEELLFEVKGQGFQKTIVLLNTMNPFECGFIEDEKYGVDAALYIGGGGNYGLEAVAEILSGKRTPSGRLSDTYARDLLSLPSMRNYGDNRFYEDGKKTSCAYVAYSEDIYIGYRYFETRYEDFVKKQGNAGNFDYSNEVVYPFGYGLSYSSFEWSGFSYKEEGNRIICSVDVKNTGLYPDRDVLELYVQKPYTEPDRTFRIEKSSLDLLDYCKTDVLEPGETEQYTLSFDKKSLSSYDAYDKKTYRLEKGTYYLSLGKNAHCAINNILAKEGYSSLSGEKDADLALEYVQDGEVLFGESNKTGYRITNRFETDSYTSVGPDQKFLSRSDWLNTWPDVYGDGGKAGKAQMEFTPEIRKAVTDLGAHAHLGKNDDTVDYVYNTETQKTETVRIPQNPVTSSGKGVLFNDVIDRNGKPLDYYDPKWDELVQCLSKEELYSYLSWGFGFADELLTIQKKISVYSDCPMGFNNHGTLYPCYPVQAGTFSKELASRLGEQMAEEASYLNIRTWWSPACNTHRHPFGGRNYEYYSEDATLGGLYAKNVVLKAQENGLVCFVKHFALNDQDTNRGDRGNFKNDDPYNGLVTYANEQTIRENYLKTFQFALEEGDAHGVMSSYNRIGTTWAGGHYGLMTEILRNEWGMKGNALTDYAGTFGYRYMNMNQGMRAGNTMWLHPSHAFPNTDHTSPAAIYYMQKSAKNVLYAEACSSRVNGMRYSDGSPVKVKGITYLWRVLVPIMDGAGSSLCLLGIFALYYFPYKKRKKREIRA